MSYQESSSFYQSSFGENDFKDGQYDLALGGGLEATTHGSQLNYESTSKTGYDQNGAVERPLSTSGGVNKEFRTSSSHSGFETGSQAGSSALEAGLQQQDALEAFQTTNSQLSSNGLEQKLATSTTYAIDSQGFYKDPNPEIIRRPAPGGTQTYTQKVLIRFLQPPPVPPPGPLIIKEVRPPQPPPPPPLYIRQRPPPPPTLPPIVIREAPPKLPPAVGTQVIKKMLPALPVPPRSVIIERLPPLPPKPRDIIVERWLPYRTQQKRRVIIERAPPPVVQAPRNIIIYYEAPKAQIVRRFENLGVQRVNPAEYIARYGTQLEDSQTLLTEARKAGVVEDITPPVGAVSNLQSSSYENYQSNEFDASMSSSSADYNVDSSLSGSYNVIGDLTTVGNGDASLAGGFGGISSSKFESSSSYSATNGTDGYVENAGSLFGDLRLVENANKFSESTGNNGNSNYEYFSSQHTITK